MAKPSGPESLVTGAVAAFALVRSAGALAQPSPRPAPQSTVEARSARRAAGTEGEEQTPAEARAVAREPGHGRHADRAGEIPAEGWKDIGARVLKEAKADNVPLLSAGVAFYALLSLFPALVAIVSIYGLVADPSEVSRQLASITQAMPRDAANLLVDQARTVAGTPGGKLGLSAGIGIVTALWSASSGMKWLLTALSLTYDEPEDRKFVKLRGTALLLTVGAAVAFVVSLGVIAAAPALARSLGLGDVGAIVFTVLRWPFLGALVVIGLAVVYRYGPNRDPAKWRWVSWGSGVAAAVWLVASAGFALYAAVAGKFAATYGSVGGVVVMMLWLYLTVLSILLGAELNAEMEHQTAKDTTVGRPRPLGERGATMADEVGAPAHPDAVAASAG
ncbi:YihY/virulence factor BrkB family protein [Aquihabitans sp. G128]|uniref:YihY/virulence factor BrkB family protein n=1 Tax=Aquihabitans sp. G128 TaxID=2849779 RepID=UPI001C22BC0A|nr:YihY/virulence factor BrkB family protein [Aquihabitans sp. G128]QXC62434.1 YihY/virulence factor BrkB family protein [Aquihabitans sp. G128]